MNTFIFDSKVYHFNENTLYTNGLTPIASFEGLKEEKEYLEGIKLSEEISLPKKTAKQLSEEQLTLALYESGEKKVTESLVNGYKQLIESKTFFPSNIILEFREPHEVFSSKIEYVMRDGSSVLLDVESNELINNILDLRESSDLLIYMTKDSVTFMNCIEDLLEDN